MHNTVKENFLSCKAQYGTNQCFFCCSHPGPYCALGKGKHRHVAYCQQGPAYCCFYAHPEISFTLSALPFPPPHIINTWIPLARAQLSRPRIPIRPACTFSPHPVFPFGGEERGMACASSLGACSLHKHSQKPPKHAKARATCALASPRSSSLGRGGRGSRRPTEGRGQGALGGRAQARPAPGAGGGRGAGGVTGMSVTFPVGMTEASPAGAGAGASQGRRGACAAANI